MNFRFFSGFGKSFFSKSKVILSNPPKNSFMTKMTQKEISNIYLKTALPTTINSMVLQNLTQILDKKQNSAIDVQNLLNSLLGTCIEQGKQICQSNPLGLNFSNTNLGITIGLQAKQCTSHPI